MRPYFWLFCFCICFGGAITSAQAYEPPSYNYSDYDVCGDYATQTAQAYFALYNYSDNDRKAIIRELFENCMRTRGKDLATAPYLVGDELQSYLEGSL
ncbi:MAG: hypothetical protein H6908_00745 [Hyphomicrobiales bacterium]|nr:hypothetical protein [Hyphomicrobiales bacterium]